MVTNIHDAKTNFSRLVQRAESGEEIVIGRAGKPVARLVPYVERTELRVPGIWKGKIWMAPDFDEPDEELLNSFYESDIDPG